MAIPIAIPLAISAYEALTAMLAAGAVTAGGAYAIDRLKKWKNENQSDETTSHGSAPLTPTQLYRKQTLTTQEIVPKYEDARPQNTRTVNTSGTTNVARVPVAKSVRRSSPSLSRSRPLLMSIPIPTELIGKVSPVELNHDELVLEGIKLHQSAQPNLANGVDLSTGVKPVSEEQLFLGAPAPEDPEQKNKSRKRLREDKKRIKDQSKQLQQSREIMEQQMRRFNGTERAHQMKKFGKAAANVIAAHIVDDAVQNKINSADMQFDSLVNDVGLSNADAVLNPENLSHIDKLKVLAQKDFPEEDFSGYTDDDYRELYSFGGYNDADSLENESNFKKITTHYSNAQRHLPARDWEEVIERLPNQSVPFWQKVDDVLTHGLGTAAKLYKFGPYGYGAYGNPGMLGGVLFEGSIE